MMLISIAVPRTATSRSRRFYAAAVAVTIGLGLGSRAMAAQLPWWLAKNAGDALYATMVVFGIGLLDPRIRARTAAVIALAICVAVEASQAIHTPWLDSVRATFLGRLVLGQGFHAFDLVCYAVGVALGIVAYGPSAVVRTATARAPRTSARARRRTSPAP